MVIHRSLHLAETGTISGLPEQITKLMKVKRIVTKYKSFLRFKIIKSN